MNIQYARHSPRAENKSLSFAAYNNQMKCAKYTHNYHHNFVSGSSVRVDTTRGSCRDVPVSAYFRRFYSWSAHQTTECVVVVWYFISRLHYFLVTRFRFDRFAILHNNQFDRSMVDWCWFTSRMAISGDQPAVAPIVPCRCNTHNFCLFCFVICLVSFRF